MKTDKKDKTQKVEKRKEKKEHKAIKRIIVIIIILILMVIVGFLVGTLILKISKKNIDTQNVGMNTLYVSEEIERRQRR